MNLSNGLAVCLIFFFAEESFRRELLKLGFKVRAGVRSAQRAESLLQVRSLVYDKVHCFCTPMLN